MLVEQHGSASYPAFMKNPITHCRAVLRVVEPDLIAVRNSLGGFSTNNDIIPEP